MPTDQRSSRDRRLWMPPPGVVPGYSIGLAVLALYLMWISKIEGAVRVRVAGLIGLCVYGGFIISTVTRKLYGGALVDSVGGVPPVMGVDANLLVFLPMLSLVLLGLWFAYRPTQLGA